MKIITLDLDPNLYEQYLKDGKRVRAEANAIWKKNLTKLQSKLGSQILAELEDGTKAADIMRHLNIPNANTYYMLIRAAQTETVEAGDL